MNPLPGVSCCFGQYERKSVRLTADRIISGWLWSAQRGDQIAIAV